MKFEIGDKVIHNRFGKGIVKVFMICFMMEDPMPNYTMDIGLRKTI